jgi:hypothetical protein
MTKSGIADKKWGHIGHKLLVVVYNSTQTLL